MTDDRDRQGLARVDAPRNASVTETQGVSNPIHDDLSPEPIYQAHVAAVRRGLDQVRLGQFATDEQVEAAFRRFDP